MPTVLQDCQTKPWLQTDDSQGQNKPATITPGNPLTCSWTPAKRPQGQPWNNLYVYQKGSIGAQDSEFALDLAVSYDTAQDLKNCNCFEFEMQQVIGGYLYNGGWQARFDSNFWWTYNFGAKDWIKSAIPINSGDFTASKPTHISAQYQRIQGGLKYLTLAVNGMCNQVSFEDAAVPQAGNYLSYAWQLDSRGQGAPINVELSAYNVFTF